MPEGSTQQVQIQNRKLSLSVDALGRLISLKNKSTGSELITYPEAAEAWRMVIPTDCSKFSGRYLAVIMDGTRLP